MPKNSGDKYNANRFAIVQSMGLLAFLAAYQIYGSTSDELISSLSARFWFTSMLATLAYFVISKYVIYNVIKRKK
jgi:hypothetical protein